MKKTKTVGFEAPLSFPLKGTELREVLKHLRVFPLAVNEPDKYAAWVETNKVIAENLTKLIDWSVKQDEPTA